MINDEHVTVAETAQWCAGTVSRREVTRLRQLATQKPTLTATMAPATSEDAQHRKAVSIEPERLVARRSPGVRDSLNGDDLHQVR
jgi:hypothetical protein